MLQIFLSLRISKLNMCLTLYTNQVLQLVMVLMTRNYCIKQSGTLIILHLALSFFMSLAIFSPLPCSSCVPHRTSLKNYYITCTLLLFFVLHFETLNEPRQETKIVKYRRVKESKEDIIICLGNSDKSSSRLFLSKCFKVGVKWIAEARGSIRMS